MGKSLIAHCKIDLFQQHPSNEEFFPPPSGGTGYKNRAMKEREQDDTPSLFRRQHWNLSFLQHCINVNVLTMPWLFFSTLILLQQIKIYYEHHQ